ncbi:MAG: sensor histidine kinase [Fibrobacterota bacterium]
MDSLLDTLFGNSWRSYGIKKKRTALTIYLLCGASVLILAGYGIKRYAEGFIALAYVDFLLASILAVLFVFMRITKRFFIVGNFLSGLAVLYFSYLFLSGGAYKSGLLWTYMMPLFTYGITGRKSGTIMTVSYLIIITLGINISPFIRFYEPGTYSQAFLAVYYASFILFCVIAYISEHIRHKTWDMLESSKTEAERMNAELESYAYVASHDLKEPLRMITSYLNLLERKNRTVLDPESLEYLEFASDGATRMKELINGLLEYSRIGSGGLKLSKTDTKAAVLEACSNMRMLIEENDADIIIEDLPEIECDHIQIVQLFQNLINNGIKFGKEGTVPQIRISCQLKEKYADFSVSDNGIGIEPDRMHRIFDIFQRLYPRGKYEGTGIGLAICRKIVERHGGKISVCSVPGEGSVFRFGIPVMR